MSALTDTRDMSTINVSPKQSEEATEVSRHFTEVDPKDLRIRIESTSGEVVTLPENLNDLLQTVLRLAASGREIGLTHRSKALTSVEAAQMLGISRPTLIKMVAAGEIPSHKVGSHNRFLRADLEQFAERRADAERAAFNAFRDLEEALDRE
ncbi:DNA binding domain-containing protein, excisionase family [Arthrobacter subterraneus]|uniref:DNA binding domain-containing protein, excisionase family n=1 Tax=Arthrobacter subterraneus TaxID=335973 RepID=A0A1G8NFI3_9MICC|nr:helix-turn-helix domain-containing protein [Arthrobacter subterraneus]SDI79019.1 DNA binding domain-containing protein, excisionase family [Arthrobacter subterraneus]